MTHGWMRIAVAAMFGAVALALAAAAGAEVATFRAGSVEPAVAPTPEPPRQLTSGEAAYLAAVADLAGPLWLMRPYEVVEDGHAICADLAAGTSPAGPERLPEQLLPALVESAGRHLCK